MRLRFVTICSIVGYVITQFVYADQVIINNNNANQTQPTPPCNQQTKDPRIPPAGVYNSKNKDGSSQTVYTTGENQPAFNDNNCNAPAPQPYVIIKPKSK